MLKVGSDVVVAAIPGDSTGSSVYMWGWNWRGWRDWLHVTNRAMLGASLHRSYPVSLSFSTLTHTHTHIHIYIYPPTHRPQHPPPSSARTLQIFLFRRKRHLEILLYFLSTFNTLNVVRRILLRSAGLHSGPSPCCDNYFNNITFIYVCCKSSLNFLPKILWMKP
jgi:hypothetical protein